MYNLALQNNYCCKSQDLTNTDKNIKSVQLQET